jgi:ribosomal protein L30E
MTKDYKIDKYIYDYTKMYKNGFIKMTKAKKIIIKNNIPKKYDSTIKILKQYNMTQFTK